MPRLRKFGRCLNERQSCSSKLQIGDSMMQYRRQRDLRLLSRGWEVAFGVATSGSTKKLAQRLQAHVPGLDRRLNTLMRASCADPAEAVVRELMASLSALKELSDTATPSISKLTSALETTKLLTAKLRDTVGRQIDLPTSSTSPKNSGSRIATIRGHSPIRGAFTFPQTGGPKPGGRFGNRRPTGH
jgi:hypothetical protein